MTVSRLDAELARLEERDPKARSARPRDADAKVLRSEQWWYDELRRRRSADTDPNGLSVPPPRQRGSGRVDVTYWAPVNTGTYDVGTRGPHRHGFNELNWTRTGVALHEVDGRRYRVGPNSLLLVRRGQVHNYLEADEVSATALRFDEGLLRLASDTPWAGLGIASACAHVPPAHVGYLDSVCELLYSTGAAAGDDSCEPQLTAKLHSSLLHSLLLLFSRWQPRETSPNDTPAGSALRSSMVHQFRDLLEEHFAKHHDVRFYASRLAIAPASLRRLLGEVTGQSTKELILDRVMVEAVRLLQFSDASVAEVAAAVGFRDALYFSRVFKRVHGRSPSAFRDHVRH